MATAQSGVVSIAADESVNGTIAGIHARKLPKQAQNKIKAMSRAWAKGGHMRAALYNAQQEANGRRSELSLQIDHLRRTIELGHGPIGKADHQRLADLESERADSTAQIAELSTEMAKLPSPSNPETLSNWLATNDRRFKTFVPVVSLRKGQSAAQALADIRNEISDAVEEIEKVRSAPLPSADAIANAVAEIERVAAKGAVYFGRCRITEPGVNGRTRVGAIRWPKFFVNNEEHGDAFALVVALNKDALIAKAKAELTALESEEAVSLTTRKERTAEIEALILSLERKEEVLIGMVEAEGAAVSRRSMMSPLAILQVELDDRPLHAPAPEKDAPDDPAAIQAAIKRSRLRDPAVPSEQKVDGADPNDFG